MQNTNVRQELRWMTILRGDVVTLLHSCIFVFFLMFRCTLTPFYLSLRFCLSVPKLKGKSGNVSYELFMFVVWCLTLLCSCFCSYFT